MKVVIIGTDPATSDSRLPWPNAARYVATSVADGIKLVEEAAPDAVVLLLDLPGMSPSETLKRLRCLTDAPLLVLDRQNGSLQAFIPTGLGEDAPVMLPPLPRKKRRAHQAELLAKDKS